MNKRKEDNIKDILNHYKKILELKGYKVIYIGLYGSQNYNVDDEKSDIDAKAIVLPTLSQIIHRKPVSAVYETEFGAIDYKDIITFNDVIRKGNFSYIEAIQSKYRIGDLETIDRLFGKIKVNFKSILGGMLEKRKALTHEYPSKTKEFEQFGCDPKQYHHIVRLYHLLYANLFENKNKSFLTYSDGENRDYMIRIKRELIEPLEEIEKEADRIIELSKEYLNSEYPDYKYEPYDNTEEVDNYIEEELRKELVK